MPCLTAISGYTWGDKCDQKPRGHNKASRRRISNTRNSTKSKPGVWRLYGLEDNAELRIQLTVFKLSFTRREGNSEKRWEKRPSFFGQADKCLTLYVVKATRVRRQSASRLTLTTATIRHILNDQFNKLSVM